MAEKRPLCIYSGQVKELLGTDSLPGFGLFEIDIDGDTMPITDISPDELYELDADDDIMPIVA